MPCTYEIYLSSSPFLWPTLPVFGVLYGDAFGLAFAFCFAFASGFTLRGGRLWGFSFLGRIGLRAAVWEDQGSGETVGPQVQKLASPCSRHGLRWLTFKYFRMTSLNVFQPPCASSSLDLFNPFFRPQPQPKSTNSNSKKTTCKLTWHKWFLELPTLCWNPIRCPHWKWSGSSEQSDLTLGWFRWLSPAS